MIYLEMNHVRKSFGDLEVLKDISLKVEEGEVLSIIGPSGSGKSTLLRCAAMLETMDRTCSCFTSFWTFWHPIFIMGSKELFLYVTICYFNIKKGL